MLYLVYLSALHVLLLCVKCFVYTAFAFRCLRLILCFFVCLFLHDLTKCCVSDLKSCLCVSWSI